MLARRTLDPSRVVPYLSLLGMALACACGSSSESDSAYMGQDAGTGGMAASGGGHPGGASPAGGSGGTMLTDSGFGDADASQAGTSQGGASQGGAAGGGGAGGSVAKTCKQAGGDRCGATVAACAGLFTLPSSDCVSCCKVPSNPVFDAEWPDPFMVRQGDTYYTFATGGTVRRRSSKDLVTWTGINAALSTAPWKKADAGFWAPTVYHAKSGKWILYYASEIKGATTQHCIGRAVANSITDTFVDSAADPFLCRNARWSIDPSVFHDNDGKDYLLWRQDTADMSSGNALIRPLDANGNLAGTEQLLVSRAKVEPSWEFDSDGGVLENPAMIHDGGTYHLFYSGFRWQTAKYANGHALCDEPVGPCTKTSTATPWQGSKGDMLGPGGADFVKAADDTLFIYMHGWLAPNVGSPNGSRKLWMYRMKVNGDAVSIAAM